MAEGGSGRGEGGMERTGRGRAQVGRWEGGALQVGGDIAKRGERSGHSGKGEGYIRLPPFS